jgi:hypothetical protein
MRTRTVNASPTTEDPTTGHHPDNTIPGEETATTTELGLGLQLSRASLMALTRLQLAIQSGDRQQTMAAMDRLHALDAEMERLVDRLPPPAGHDAEWGAIAKHVSDQKLAIAFEKLALVSEISGPAMISAAAPPLVLGPRQEEEATELPPLPEWPALPAVEPREWKPASSGVLALVFALLVTVALAAAAVLMTTF